MTIGPIKIYSSDSDQNFLSVDFCFKFKDKEVAKKFSNSICWLSAITGIDPIDFMRFIVDKSKA